MKPNKKINEWLDMYSKNQLKPSELLAKIVGEFDQKHLPYLFSSIFTKEEIKTFANRLLIVQKLKKDMPQHEIARKLKVGVTTVTRGSRELARGKFDFI